MNQQNIYVYVPEAKVTAFLTKYVTATTKGGRHRRDGALRQDEKLEEPVDTVAGDCCRNNLEHCHYVG